MRTLIRLLKLYAWAQSFKPKKRRKKRGKKKRKKGA